MLIYLISFLLFFQFQAFSQNLKYNNGDDYNLVEEIPSIGAEIDWTKGILRASVTIPVSDTNANIGRFYSQIQNEANEILQSKLNKAIALVKLSKDFRIGDYYNAYPEIRYEIFSYLENAKYYSVTKEGDKFKAVAELFLYGKNGISSIFFKNVQKRQVTNYINMSDGLEYFDTLIIDMVMYGGFSPSIAPRIYDEDGLLLYGPETMKYEDFVNNGVCLYTKSLSYAFSSERAGKRIFYTMPKNITGQLNTDIVLFNSDAARLFASKRTLDYINKGNVIIVVP